MLHFIFHIYKSPLAMLHTDIVIGPAGGNFCDVYGDGVEVTVPSGALSSAKTVSVKTMTDRGRWHEDDTIYIGQVCVLVLVCQLVTS